MKLITKHECTFKYTKTNINHIINNNNNNFTYYFDSNTWVQILIPYWIKIERLSLQNQLYIPPCGLNAMSGFARRHAKPVLGLCIASSPGQCNVIRI